MCFIHYCWGERSHVQWLEYRIVGATGAVGTALLELLQEREFPVGELYALASENSAGESLRFSGRSLRVENAADFDWSQAQLAFSSPVWKPAPVMPKRRATPGVW